MNLGDSGIDELIPHWTKPLDLIRMSAFEWWLRGPRKVGANYSSASADLDLNYTRLDGLRPEYDSHPRPVRGYIKGSEKHLLMTFGHAVPTLAVRHLCP